jgi:hypothetical protein
LQLICLHDNRLIDHLFQAWLVNGVNNRPVSSNYPIGQGMRACTTDNLLLRASDSDAGPKNPTCVSGMLIFFPPFPLTSSPMFCFDVPASLIAHVSDQILNALLLLLLLMVYARIPCLMRLAGVVPCSWELFDGEWAIRAIAYVVT